MGLQRFQIDPTEPRKRSSSSLHCKKSVTGIHKGKMSDLGSLHCTYSRVGMMCCDVHGAWFRGLRSTHIRISSRLSPPLSPYCESMWSAQSRLWCCRVLYVHLILLSLLFSGQLESCMAHTDITSALT